LIIRDFSLSRQSPPSKVCHQGKSNSLEDQIRTELEEKRGGAFERPPGGSGRHQNLY